MEKFLGGFLWGLTHKYTWLIITAVVMALVVHWAFSAELSCTDSGQYTHCWNNHGETVITTEHNGEYSHTWTSRGDKFTTWDHNGIERTWRTK